MTQIRTRAFANRIVEYLLDPASYSEKKFDSSLFTVVRKNSIRATPYGEVTSVSRELHGVCFGPHIELVMILLRHAYRGLCDSTTPRQYSRAISGAMQTFAEPIAIGGRASFPDPSFLLHGISKKNLAAAVRRFECNGRIIHETMALADAFLREYSGPLHLEHDLKMFVEEGVAEDCFGLCCYITREKEEYPHGTDKSYIAKVSFFLDALNREMYVITIQGQRVYSADKNRSRYFARLAAVLGMDPRTFVLKKVCELGRAQGYRKIRVIRPEHHPMFIDGHSGFTAQYEPVIRQAGITETCGCYLQRDL